MNFKKILKPFILIPNIPFAIIMSIYILIKVYKHTGYTEMQIIKEKEGKILNDEIKKHIEKIYPKYFRYTIAFIFYLWVGVNFL